jgi:hypothetical protein
MILVFIVSLFLNPDDPTKLNSVFYTIEDFQDSLEQTFDGIKSLETNSVSDVSIKNTEFLIFINYLFPYEAENANQKKFKYTIDINEGILSDL